jgi:hypothetical protein
MRISITQLWIFAFVALSLLGAAVAFVIGLSLLFALLIVIGGSLAGVIFALIILPKDYK